MRIWQKAARTPWAITEDHLRVILDIASRDNATPEAVAARLGRDLENTYEVEYRDGVAVLSVEGPLFRYANLFTRVSGATSYELLAQDFQAAIDDDQVRAVLLNINSPGGEADGNAEFAEMIYRARGTKPIVAYVGGLGASAAYWIASAADEVIAHETAMLGSIGVRTALVDDSERMAMEGLREYVIVSSQSPDKALDPAEASDRARVQQLVDDLAAVFVAKVARNRGVEESVVLEDFGRGDILVGQKAVDAGLADRLGTYEDTVAELIERTADRSAMTFPGFSGATAMPAAGGLNGGCEPMWLTDKKPAAGEEQRHVEATAANFQTYCPEAAAELREQGKADAAASIEEQREAASTAERERIQAILGCEEAKGRTKLAQELAVTPGMSEEHAKRVLASASREDNGFLAAVPDPDVGPDEPEASGDPRAAAAAAVDRARQGGLIR
ncbi:S49 family peptidase [Spiribacter halobius]|uniref:S49 family peptidase n=1 Tax=Sediminicurvatus halobius TaxID=2182432 RepID=A0A2U2MXT8_9GAMM|nr:S49 family peptidase [Spiribacter halobius]PWG61766.1 S49 family peptidase [Spiribacter halobius]UEX76800.1 S49 family peptidase [Spiribacter halobius]